MISVGGWKGTKNWDPVLKASDRCNGTPPCAGVALRGKKAEGRRKTQ